MLREFAVRVDRQGLHDITGDLADEVVQSGLGEGLCTLFIQHTSASLLIQENHDPSARRDLEAWLNRLVPEEDSLYTHTVGGPDDMPAHIKAALTATSVSIPVASGRLALGTWQGVFLCEHRNQARPRRLVLTLAGE